MRQVTPCTRSTPEPTSRCEPSLVGVGAPSVLVFGTGGGRAAEAPPRTGGLNSSFPFSFRCSTCGSVTDRCSSRRPLLRLLQLPRLLPWQETFRARAAWGASLLLSVRLLSFLHSNVVPDPV